MQPTEKSIEIVVQVLGSRPAALTWLNSPHPELDGRTPQEVIHEGGAPVMESMLKGALEGIPS